MFDENYVIENIKKPLTPAKIKKLLIETKNEDKYYKEKITILFNNKKGLEKYLYNELSLNDWCQYNNKFYHDIVALFLLHIAGLSKNGPNHVFNNPVIDKIYNETFPISLTKLNSEGFFYRGGGVVNHFNTLQNAAYTSKINSSSENFQQFCNEIELIGLGLGNNPDGGLCLKNFRIVLESDWNNVISNINQNYSALTTESVFGYGVFNDDGIVCEIKKVGCDKFIQNINEEIKRLELLSDDFGCEKAEILILLNRIAYHLEDAPIDIKSGIVEEIKKLDVVSPYLYCLIVPILMKEPLLRQSSRIIEYMPIRNNVELFNFFKITGMKYYTSEDISNYVKVSEVELEINNFSYVIDNNTMYKMCGIENIKAFVTKSFEILSKDDKDRFASTFYLDFCKYYINQIGLKNMTKNDSHLCALISEIDQVGRHGLRSFRLINHYDEAKEGLIVFKAFLELIKNSDVKLALPELFKDIEPSEINEFIESDSIQKYTEKYIETKVVPYKVTELTQKWSHVKEIFGNLAKMIECSKLNELKFENELGLTVDFHGN